MLSNGSLKIDTSNLTSKLGVTIFWVRAVQSRDNAAYLEVILRIYEEIIPFVASIKVKNETE